MGRRIEKSEPHRIRIIRPKISAKQRNDQFRHESPTGAIFRTYRTALSGPILTWNIFIIFQVIVVGRFHSFAPSLPVRHLESRGGALDIKKHGMLVGKLEFNSYENLIPMWTLPELHYTPERCHVKRNRFDY